MDWVTVSRRQVEEDTLPHICIVCGDAATDRIHKTFTYAPNWVSLLYFIAFFPGVIAEKRFGKEMRVACPVCAKHTRHWKNVYIAAAVGWLPGALLAFVGFFGGMWLDPGNDFEARVNGLVGGISVGLLIWGGLFLYFESLLITVKKITDEDITFEKVSDAFARAVGDSQDSVDV